MLARTPQKAGELFEQYRFRDGLTEVMNLARAANKYFNDSEPWKTARTDPVRCATAINISVQLTRSLAILMSPIVPSSAEKLWQMLRLPGKAATQSWDDAGALPIPDAHVLGTTEILFAKIEDETIAGEISALGNVPAAPAAAPVAAGPGPVMIDDFKKIDLRVGKILKAERLPKSEKLLKLQVAVGPETRQIIAGIAKHYAPEDLVGKNVVVVYNLRPAKLMGEDSQGMLLAASDGSGKLAIVVPAEDIASGAIVR